MNPANNEPKHWYFYALCKDIPEVIEEAETVYGSENESDYIFESTSPSVDTASESSYNSVCERCTSPAWEAWSSGYKA